MKQFIAELDRMCEGLAQSIKEYEAGNASNFNEAKFLTQLSNVEQKTANRVAMEV